MKQEQFQRYKDLGYTHYISYQKNHKEYGYFPVEFPTTKCAVGIHLNEIKKDHTNVNLVVLEL